MRKKGFTVIALMLILLFSCRCTASGSLECGLQDDKWNWNPGKEATMTGTVRNDGEEIEDAVLHLEISDVSAEDAGSAVFTTMNGSRILVRKQKDTYTTTLPAGEDIPFTATWFTPDDMTGIDRIRIRLTVSDAEGNIMNETELRMGSFEDEIQADADEGSAAGVFQPVTLILLAAGVLFWGAAVLRNRLIKKKYEGESQ